MIISGCGLLQEFYPTLSMHFKAVVSRGGGEGGGGGRERERGGRGEGGGEGRGEWEGGRGVRRGGRSVKCNLLLLKNESVVAMRIM